MTSRWMAMPSSPNCMNQKRLVMRRFLNIFLVAAFAITCAWPQASTGSVSGSVRDPSGAVIPNAEVTLTNADTNVALTTKTNEAGLYSYPGVVSGPYRLVVTAPGMEKYEGTFSLQVAQEMVIDPAMKVGQASTTIRVVDVTPLVTVENATVASNMEHARIEQLPMKGRMPNSLMAALPPMGIFRAYGAPADAIEWVLDGSVVTDRRWNMSLFAQAPGVGAFQEFTVESNAVSAKFTRPTSVIVSTKNGTNQLHGTVYEINRNNGIGLARARTDYYTKAPELNRNEFG